MYIYYDIIIISVERVFFRASSGQIDKAYTNMIYDENCIMEKGFEVGNGCYRVGSVYPYSPLSTPMIKLSYYFTMCMLNTTKSRL